MPRPIAWIARDICKDWPKPYFGAAPYLEAMLDLNDIEDNYGEDSARSIVSYFLSNANTWKGEKARELKLELRTILGIEPKPNGQIRKKVWLR